MQIVHLEAEVSRLKEEVTNQEIAKRSLEAELKVKDNALVNVT